MRHLLYFFYLITFLFIFVSRVNASYDPLSVPNNRIGIHILYPSELSQAAELVNSTGGDWGYVTIPIQANDKNLNTWQQFMNDCAKFHLIPIIRIATTGDYFEKGSWSKPNIYDVIDFANFLNDLDWPTRNRYVIVFNEPNRGDEWGGVPNPTEYAQVLSMAVDIFKQRNNDFFIISAGLDNASINLPDQSINNYTFMSSMNEEVPGIFEKIDGLGSHSYPNPAFSSPPSLSNRGIYSYIFQQQLAFQLSGKKLPIFITETGWSSNKVSQDTQSQYYIQSFNKYWNDDSIVAITPFILGSEQGPFAQFAFIKNNQKNKIYYAVFNYPKTKGEPILNPLIKNKIEAAEKLPTKNFKSINLDSIFKRIENPQKIFFKWILGI